MYIRGTFKPKPSSERTEAHQQEIATGFRATESGLQASIKMATNVAVKVLDGKFDWRDYGVNCPKLNDEKTISDWVMALENDYFQRHPRTPKTERSWHSHYGTYFNRLPQKNMLSEAILRNELTQTVPNSCTRKMMAIAFRRVGNLAGLNIDFIKSLQGSYSSRRSAPRDLPSDRAIEEAILSIPDPAWRWMAGAIATYGLRPHEAYHLDITDPNRVRIGEKTKTGGHVAPPLPPYWVTTFDLKNQHLPSVPFDIASGEHNKPLGQLVSRSFKKFDMPFRPYDLRHAWAVRASRYNLPISVAARWMGHSVQIHNLVYQAWITEETERELWREACQRLQEDID